MLYLRARECRRVLLGSWTGRSRTCFPVGWLRYPCATSIVRLPRGWCHRMTRMASPARRILPRRKCYDMSFCSGDFDDGNVFQPHSSVHIIKHAYNPQNMRAEWHACIPHTKPIVSASQCSLSENYFTPRPVMTALNKSVRLFQILISWIFNPFC